MITRHNCLTGMTSRLGDAWDCPKCRVRLLEAFRRPADAPETGLRTVPHLLAGPINPSPWIASGSTFAQDGLGIEHVTDTDIRWLSIPQTGIWFARCSCGWERTGRWEKSQGPTWATGQAEAAADTHKELTEEEDL